MDPAYSGDPDELDSVTNSGIDSWGVKDTRTASADLDLVGGSVSRRDASRNGNDGLGEKHDDGCGVGLYVKDRPASRNDCWAVSETCLGKEC